uniref:Uncharacterized protein n=1 Tax=Panagrolaimus sp. JU765 TaxID=591449 RepID=A0AC34Q3I8_9BILA
MRVCFLSFLILHAIYGRILVVPSSDWNTQYGYPGVRLRLTRKGAEHVKDVAVKLLNEQLAQLNGFHLQYPFSRPGLEGIIYVNEIRTLQYQPPQAAHIRFQEPTYLILGFENAAINLGGRFLGVSGVFQVPGYVHGSLRGMSMTIVASFKATPEGLMSVQVVNCSTVIAEIQFTLEPEGPLGPVVKTFEAQINDAIRAKIPEIFCKGLQDIIEKNSPEMFQRLTKAQLSEHFQGISTSSVVIDRFIRRFTEGLYIDNRNIADPVVTSEYFEIQQRGEFNYNDSLSDTPFFPRPMPNEADSERMLYLYGSEYTLNSLLYHAYESDRLSMMLEPSALPPKYQGFIRTSCDGEQIGASDESDLISGICVGKLIPAIAENYPNTTTKFVLLPSSLPEVKFYEGLSTMDVKTKILTYVLDRRTNREKQILVSSADGIADIRLAAEEGKFAGDLKLRRLNARLHRSAIGGIDPDSIAQLSPLAKTFLGPQLSSGLKRGFPYPLKDSISFIEPELKIKHGYARLATDFMVRTSEVLDEIDSASKWWTDYPTGKYTDYARAQETYRSMIDNVWSKPKRLGRSASYTNLTYIKEAQHDYPIQRSPTVSSLAPSLALPQYYREAERIVHTAPVYKPFVNDWYSKAYSTARFIDTHREIARPYKPIDVTPTYYSSHVPYYSFQTRRIFFEKKNQPSYLRGSQIYLDKYVSARLKADDFANRFAYSAYEWGKPHDYRFNRHFMMGSKVNVPCALGLPHSYMDAQALRRMHKLTGRYYHG